MPVQTGGLKPKKEKYYKCPVCKGPFRKWSTTQKTCEKFACAMELAKRDREKKERKADQERKVEIRPRREWISAAQNAFNAFIRERDKGEACICCGKTAEQQYGGSWDAGHYLSRGAYPELRFNEDNCHKQLKSCNAGSGKFAHKQKTVSQGYRERLILKIGLERVEKLEGPHEPQKYTVDQLREIQTTYKAKLKELIRREQ